MDNSGEKAIEFLTSSFGSYNSVDLIAKVSGLRLLPENSEKAIRLDLICHTLASLNNNTRNRITRKKLDSIINSKIISESIFKHQEDPMTQLFCEEISFYNGGFRIFPGIYTSIVFQLRHTFEAIFHSQNNSIPASLKERIEQCISFVLTISEAIASKANISRNTDTKYYSKIKVPEMYGLMQLAMSCTFRNEEFERLAAIYGTNLDNMSWLFSNVDEKNIVNYHIEKGPLIDKPILKTSGIFIITDPSSLLHALRNQILHILSENSLIAFFRDSYISKVWNTVEESMEWLDFDPLSLEIPKSTADRPFIWGAFSFDYDKVAIIILTFDDFVDLNRDYININLSSYKTAFDEIRRSVCQPTESPKEILVIFLNSIYHRSMSFEFFRVDDVNLTFSTEGFELVSHIESKKNLFFYKFAIAISRLRNRTKVFGADSLAEYGMFKEHEYSFTLSDEILPTLLIVSDDYARGVRKESLNKLDRHCVWVPFLNSFADVILMHDQSFPLYSLIDFPFSSDFMLDGFIKSFWIRCKQLLTPGLGNLRKVCIEIIDMIAYWMLELKKEINSLLDIEEYRPDYFVIQLQFDTSEDWTDLKYTENSFDEMAPYTLEPVEPNLINIKFRPTFNNLMFSSSNQGERNFLTDLFNCILNLIKISPSANWTAEVINNSIPLGRKKKLSTLNTSSFPELDPIDIVNPRMIDRIDSNLLIDDLADHFTQIGMNSVKSRSEQVDLVKNIIVPFFWEKLTNEIKKYNATDLLQFILLQNESLTHDRVLDELQLPMRLELFDPKIIMKDFEGHYYDIIRASPACRFLVECAISFSPIGQKPLSQYSYDQLLALSHEIIFWGFIGDLLHFEISDVKIELLPNYHLRINQQEYEYAFKLFSQQISFSNLAQYTRNFEKYWKKGEGAQNSSTTQDSTLGEFDMEFKQEFGYSQEDLIIFESVLMELSRHKNKSVVNITERHLKEKFNGKLPVPIVNKILNQWSLSKRTNFFSIEDDPHVKGFEFYPWRFNRAYSFVRRPILKLVNGEGVSYMYGYRHLKVAVDNFTSLVLNNRLENRIKSERLKAIISSFADARGKRFNQEVYDVLKSNNTFLVLKGVKKIKDLKIVDQNGNELGDIDVFVVDHYESRILLIECKDFLAARTPYELNLELKKVFQGKNSQINKHLRRYKWAKKNINNIINVLGLQKDIQWTIDGLFVTSYPLLSSYIKRIKKIKFMSINELKKKYQKPDIR